MRSILPITEAVQAAIYYAEFTDSTISEYRWACDKLKPLVTDQDRLRISPLMSVSSRILADEVERLRAELNTNKTIIEHELNTVLSDCCEAPAVVAGKPNSTQWYVCPQCCQPCDVYYQDKNTQPK
jgi:hypothetical protein